MPDQKNCKVTASVTYDNINDYGSGGLSSSLYCGPDAEPDQLREVADLLNLMAVQLRERATRDEPNKNTKDPEPIDA